jgi:uncharacterized protein YjaG (DUF416 family)
MVRLLRFDKTQLLAKIAQLSEQDRTAFAAAIAERMLGAYAKYSNRTGRGSPSQLREILESVWANLAGIPMSEQGIATMIDRATGLLPGEDHRPWVLEQGAAEDAVSAVIYSLRSRMSGLPEEAMWAATVACDAVDDFVINRDDIDMNSPGSEARVVADPLMQAELGRQQRDLDELLRGTATLQGLQERSKSEAAQFIP